MNRKFFNLLLMGALAVTAIGSVSSCKDYDDDINNLQDQINKVALQTSVDELKTQLANVQSAATAAQAAADQALTKAVGGQTAADGAQTTADEALAKAEEALATALAALPSTDATAIREALATINATAEENATNVAQAIQDAADAAAAAAAANTAAGNAQTSADAANAAAEEAKTEAATKAQEAKDYADEKIAEKLAELETTLSAVQNNEQVIAAIKSIAKAEVDAAIPADLSEKLDALTELINNAGTKEEIQELLASVRSFQGGIDALYTAVTGIEVFGSINAHMASILYNDEALMSIVCGKVADDYTFGEDDSEEGYKALTTVTFTKDAVFSFSSSELIVRVNPTNADLTNADIKFIDSKGNDLDDVIEVTNVERFDGLLYATRGTGNKTGLWKISVKSGEGVDAEEINSTVTTEVPDAEDPASILYAIAMNNTKDAADRYVVSTYDVTFGTEDYNVTATSLDNVTVKAASKTEGTALSDIKPNGGATAAYAVNNGEEFEVSFADDDVKEFEYFYVVRDDKHADESTSELNVWNTYDYEGLGEMITVNHGTGKATLKVTIPSTYKKGSEVQFRVFAIDYTGAVVLNQPFRVYVGADKINQDITGNLKVTDYEEMKTAKFAINIELSSEITELPRFVKVKNAGGDDVQINVEFFETADDDATALETTDVAKANYVQFSTGYAANIRKLADGAVATGAVEFKDGNDLVVNTINVSLTKVMPTAADARAFLNNEGTLFTWKQKQLVNGVYTAYLYPADDEWTLTAENGYKKMTDAIDNLPVENAYLKIANAKLGDPDDDEKKAYDADLEVEASENWEVDVPVAADDFETKLIDNTTKHDAVFGYNFGAISSENEGADYKVDATGTDAEFKMIFANPLAEAAQSYDWATGAKNYLTYGNTEAEDGNLLAKINGTNTFDNTVFGNTMDQLINGDVRKYVSTYAKLYTKGTKIEQYFKAVVSSGELSFTKASGASNPQGDVESTLEITLTDAFGETHEYKLPFTVKRAE